MHPIEPFECHWHASRAMLWAYLAISLLAVSAVFIADWPALWRALALLGLLAHSLFALPRQLLLTHPSAISGLKHDERGWQLFSKAKGWQSVQLLPESIALPALIVLRWRLPGQWWGRGLCIASDALEAHSHRRLRVRLRFSRRRWAAVR